MLISIITRESAPSCHDEEACSRVRHGYALFCLRLMTKNSSTVQHISTSFENNMIAVK